MRLEAASFEHWFELAHDRWAPGAEQHGTVLSAFGEGMNWYKHNAEIIERIALDDGRVNPVRLIQAVAIMSPRTNWERLLAKLPDDTILYPGHLYSREPSGTLGETRRTNHVYRMRSIEDWRRFMG